MKDLLSTKKVSELIADTYTLSVVLKEFCQQHEDIEEIFNILPLVKYLHRNIDVCYARVIDSEQY